MRRDTSASYTGNTSIPKKYVGFSLIQKRGESDYKFIRRIITEIILQVNSSLTVYELRMELEELIDIKMNQAYLLNTLVYKDSGITLVGDVISASIANERLSRNILKVGEDILIQAGGKMEEADFFFHIRRRTIISLSDITILDSLKIEKKIKQRKQKKKTIFYISKK